MILYEGRDNLGKSNRDVTRAQMIGCLELMKTVKTSVIFCRLFP